MRIKGIHLAGLAVALVGGGAKDALADVTIGSATTTPLTTSGSGNVTISSGGSIAVTAGQAAVTADANLPPGNVTNSGALTSNNADNSTGIVLSPGGAGTITSSGQIQLMEDYTPTDTDSDGDLDGTFALGTNRNGIWLTGGTFTGTVTNSGGITIEGNNSAGIRIDGLLDGDLISSGAGIHIAGDNTYVIAVTGGAGNGVTGDITTSGAFSAHGAGATGVLIAAPVTGNVSINGLWTISGYRNTIRPADVSHLDADDLLQGGSAVEVQQSIGQGLTIAGPGVEFDQGEDTTTANIAVFGSAPSVHVVAGATDDILLGADSHGFGFDVRGTVAAVGVYDGVTATALRIEGSATHSVTVTGGAALDNVVSANAIEADAYGLYVGQHADVGSVVERKGIIISSTANIGPAHSSYAFFFAPTATVTSFNNLGAITANGFGQYANATAITDQSNSLATITNSGSIVALLTPIDPDPTDNVPPPPTTGTATAIDVSNSNIAVTLTQNAYTPFTDDDSVDNDVSIQPAIKIVGNILFGSGADTFNLNAGTVTGDISFGNGLDHFNLAAGTTFTGAMSDSDGLLDIDNSGTMVLTGGESDIRNAHFRSGSRITLQLADNPINSATIVSGGTVTFDSNSTLTVLAPAGLPDSAPDQTILSAVALNIDPGAHVTDNLGVASSYIYNFTINQSFNTLTASYVLKTPADLGFGANQAAAYPELLQALRTDGAAADAVAAITDAATFNNAYIQLMPSYSSASAELATTAIQQEQSATSNRLAATRLHNLNEVSAWAQEIGYVINREPPDVNGEKFRGNGFGFALGIDGPLNNGALFGLSASFITSDAEQPARPDGQISSSFGQFNAYLGSAWGPIDLDFVAGAGLGRMRDRRFIEIGNLRELAEAEWWSYEGHGMIRASAPMTTGGWLTMTPQIALTYVALSEQGYEENGAGALDVSADGATTQRLWGDAAVEFSAQLFHSGQTVVAPRLTLGYRANLINDPTDRTFHYEGGNDFTLTDDDYGSGGALVGVGLDATNGYSTLSVSYEGEFSDQIKRNSLNVALRYRF